MLSKREKIIMMTAAILIVLAGLFGFMYGSKLSAVKSYFIDVKLERDKQRAMDRQTLDDIISNANASMEAKTVAEKKLLSIVANSEKEMIIEAMIKYKGFDDVVVFITDTSAEVIIKAKKLDSNQLSQIKEIVCRESGLNASNIIVQTRS
jgi:stage III sporulation protein AH